MTIKLALLMTGNELLLGDTIDSNSAMIAKNLLPIGIDVSLKVTVGDSLTDLTEQLQYLNNNYDIVIVNGGLGPTQDDLSVEAVGKAFAINIVENQEAKAHVISWCEQRQFSANAANLKQSLMPESATIFANAPGSASAFFLQEKALIIVTPGVPSELRQILSRDILPLLQQYFAITPQPATEYYQTFGIGESRLQESLNNDFLELSSFYDVSFRAGLPLLELKLTPKQSESSEKAKALKDRFLQSISDMIIDHGKKSLSECLIELFKEKNLSLGFAESCTGGLMASEITRISGASSIFQGSIVSYSNDVKEQALSVSKQHLEQQGAVSKEVAEQMLMGAFKQLHCDYGAAVTGIAGPTGGSKEKPVGTVWLAFGNQENQQCYCLKIPGSRTVFQTFLSAIAFDLLRRQLLNLDIKPKYLQRYLVGQ
jgi:nicotinamide-nucleotide amidase